MNRDCHFSQVLAIGNEGFAIQAGDCRIMIDAPYCAVPWVGTAPCCDAGALPAADILLFTHAHPDHFDPAAARDLAAATQACVVGPASVCEALGDALPEEQRLLLEPPRLRRRKDPVAAEADIGLVRVAALRTRHSPDHNSYLVQAPGLRFFHDGDNEDARPLQRGFLGELDMLFIAPWQGSGWAECVERLAPRHWFLMHMTSAEHDRHDRGDFLPELCGHVPRPESLVALRPGETWRQTK